MSKQHLLRRAQTQEQKRAMIERLYALWMRYPTLRFGQLLLNGFPAHLYSVEDTDLIEGLEALYTDVVHVEKEEQS